MDNNSIKSSLSNTDKKVEILSFAEISSQIVKILDKLCKNVSRYFYVHA